MEKLWSADWNGMFVPSTPLLEVFLRGTLVYLILFFILRFFLKRQVGVIGIPDLLVVVLIADASQNALAADYKSITEGALLILTVVFWNYTLDWIGFRFPSLQGLVRPGELILFKNGRLLRRNLDQEKITEEELMSQVRQHGLESLKEVDKIFIEGDGNISVIKKGENSCEKPSKKKGV